MQHACVTACAYKQCIHRWVHTIYAMHTEFTLHTQHLFYSTLWVPQSHQLIPHLTMPRQPLPPQTPQRTSPSLLCTSVSSNPFESGLTGSRSFSHGAILDCASHTLFLSHSHTHTCTHSPSISVFVRLHPSASSGGESRFKSPNWIIPLSSFAIQTFFPCCFDSDCK